MGTASYISYIGRRGRIVAATCTTAGKTEFYRDAVGSVVMTTNYNSPIGKSQRFAAYGKELTPNSYYSNYRMGWVGSMGYRATPLPHAETYIRARHYSNTDSRWTTRDPLWPEEPAFGYAGSNPITKIDYYGTNPKKNPKKPVHQKPKRKKPPVVLDPGTVNIVEEYCGDDGSLGGLGQPIKCFGINSSFPVCDKTNPNFNLCGMAIIGINPTEGANQSNWPKPARQCSLPWPCDSFGGEYCCQECRMRLCCALGPYPAPGPKPVPLPPQKLPVHPDPKIPGPLWGPPFQEF